jgi:hypothetical protein
VLLGLDSRVVGWFLDFVAEDDVRAGKVVRSVLDMCCLEDVPDAVAKALGGPVLLAPLSPILLALGGPFPKFQRSPMSDRLAFGMLFYMRLAHLHTSSDVVSVLFSTMSALKNELTARSPKTRTPQSY